jgi:hypothetical protein
MNELYHSESPYGLRWGWYCLFKKYILDVIKVIFFFSHKHDESFLCPFWTCSCPCLKPELYVK